MIEYDYNVRLQLARERQAELACEYRRAQAQARDGREDARKAGLVQLVGRLRRRKVARVAT